MSHHPDPPRSRDGHHGKPHVKWITIVGLVLMVGAMAIYVLTMDEAVVPGQPDRQPVPAAP